MKKGLEKRGGGGKGGIGLQQGVKTPEAASLIRSV